MTGQKWRGFAPVALSALLLILMGCASPAAGPAATLEPSATGSPAGNGVAPASGPGHIVYSTAEWQVYRLAASPGAKPEDVTAALDKLSPRARDQQLNLSPDGQWLVLLTERFDAECAGWNCLAVVKGDLSSGQVVRAGGDLVHPDGYPAVASGGNLIVYPNGGGAHTHDLWAVTRTGTQWNAPVLLTRDSPFAYNDQPALSRDGQRVLYDCGPQPYAAEGTALCEVGSDGRGFRVVRTTAQAPAGLAARGALHHPAYAPDGGIVFEGDWDGEQIWRLAPGARDPARMKTDFADDNSPCVLPDGRIASLWLGRPGGSSQHEIKIMAADGSSSYMALTGVDVADVGLGCGG